MSNCTNSGCACTPNRSIHCTVNSCAHHCKNEQYCGLDTIQVGTHEANPHHGSVYRLPELQADAVTPGRPEGRLTYFSIAEGGCYDG